VIDADAENECPNMTALTVIDHDLAARCRLHRLVILAGLELRPFEPLKVWPEGGGGVAL